LLPLFHFQLTRVKLESELDLAPLVLKLGSGEDGRESLFRRETPVVECSAPGYRIAPGHFIFTESTLLRAAA
jgi:hypothetical protein